LETCAAATAKSLSESDAAFLGCTCAPLTQDAQRQPRKAATLFSLLRLCHFAEWRALGKAALQIVMAIILLRLSFRPVNDQIVNLDQMQDQIFRERVLRARGMTEAERFNETLEMIETAYVAMSGFVSMNHPDADEASQRGLLHQHIARLRRIEGRNLFTPAPAA